MSTRYRLISTPEAVAAHFRLGAFEPFPPRQEIAPLEPVAIVRSTIGGGRELRLVRWGLIPSWTRDPSRITLFSARAETAHEKPAFRGGLRHWRCLLPADGFHLRAGRGRSAVRRLAVPRQGSLFAIGAVADHWLGADGSEIETMAMLTVPANAAVAPFAERMPLLVATGDHDRWLDCRAADSGAIADLLAVPPSDAVAVIPAEAGTGVTGDDA